MLALRRALLLDNSGLKLLDSISANVIGVSGGKQASVEVCLPAMEHYEQAEAHSHRSELPCTGKSEPTQGKEGIYGMFLLGVGSFNASYHLKILSREADCYECLSRRRKPTMIWVASVMRQPEKGEEVHGVGKQ